MVLTDVSSSASVGTPGGRVDLICFTAALRSATASKNIFSNAAIVGRWGSSSGSAPGGSFGSVDADIFGNGLDCAISRGEVCSTVLEGMLNN